MNKTPIVQEIINIKRQGKNGEYSLYGSTLVKIKQQIKVHPIAIKISPMKINIPPIPLMIVALPALFHKILNASLAALQKFLPYIAISIQAFLLINLMNLSKQAAIHYMYFKRHFIGYLSPQPVFLDYYSMYAKIILIN